MCGEEHENESPCKKKVRLDESFAAKLLENQILTNPLITDRIFTDIPYCDLLNCSLVSKAWNLTCRGILVERFKTYLTLSLETTLSRLVEFLNVISNVLPGHQHPFNGVRIEFKFGRGLQRWYFSSEPFLDPLTRILSMLEVKHVSLSKSMLWLDDTDFRSIFNTLVIPHLRTIEFLEILKFIEIGNLKALSEQLNVDSLPNLKGLNVDLFSAERLGTADLDFFARILRACPNLKALPPLLPSQLPTLRATNKLDLASNVRFNYMSLTSDDMKLLLEYSPLIKNLEISEHEDEDQNQYEGGSISGLLPLFSLQLRHFLQRLHVPLELLVAILLQNTCPSLSNLKELSVHGSQIWFPCLIKNKAVRFAGFLPNLKSVTFSWDDRSSDWLQEKYGSENYADAPIQFYACQTAASLDSVTELKLWYVSPFEDEKKMVLMDLDQIFPFVTHLDIHIIISKSEELLKWVCESWGDVLQVLVLRKTRCLGLRPDRDMDSMGHEWKVLQESKRKPLPSESMYSEKLSQLRHLQLEFWHPTEPDSAGNCVDEKAQVKGTFEPRTGKNVELIIWGCRAEKRMKIFKAGHNVFDSILALHSCPRNLELSVMEQILATKSICKNLCKMLPTPDLLRCYRVNRNWNAVAREELSEFRSFTFGLRPMNFENGWTRSNLTRQLEATEKLFNGLKLIVCPSHSENSRRIDTAEAATRFLENSNLDFSYKHFKALQVQGLDEDYPLLEKNKLDHPLLIRMRAKVVKLFQTLLTKLELDQVQTLFGPIENFDELFRDAEGTLFVPNLKSIKFVDPVKLPEHSQVFKRLLVDLESLETIDVPFSNKLLPLVSSAGRAHCVKHIQLYNLPEKELLLPGSILSHDGDESENEMALHDPRTALGCLLKFAQEQQSQTKTIFVGDSVALGQDSESVFGEIFQLLCTSSYESLQKLHVSLSLLHLISQVYTRPLVTLMKLELLFDKSETGQLLHKIPFSQMAPNLESVEVTCSMYSFGLQNMVPAEQQSGISDTLLQPCVSVKSLRIKITFDDNNFKEIIRCSSGPQLWNIDYIAGAFPKVTNLSFSRIDVSTTQSGNAFFKMLSSAWKAWPNLKSIKLYSSSDVSAISLETWLLGISTAEWALWKEILENQLIIPDIPDSVHYAPSTFSIRNCKNLQEIWVNGFIKTRILGRIYDKKDPTWDKIQLLPRSPFDHGRIDGAAGENDVRYWVL